LVFSVCSLFFFFSLFGFFSCSSVLPLLRTKTMVMKALGVVGWIEAPSSVISHFSVR
jgi:hypothetical protein